jgi:hydrogenase maturation protein HypF
LPGRLPAAADIQSVEECAAPDELPAGFEIRISAEAGGVRVAGILPDLATCPDCLREILDPNDRRFGYPFANCTHCGPRYSIIEALPYDRANTTMRGFAMCPVCEAEYRDPGNRRFHAQPNACPVCGPSLAWAPADGSVQAVRGLALQAAEEALRGGRIVAVKGIGGFHLMVDARNEKAVRRLRERKQRDEKPFAVLFPAVEAIEAVCEVSEAERKWLESQAAPIVLLQKRAGARRLAEDLAPGLPWIGAMLPYTPLHHVLMRALGFPVVATSGNLTDEPICTDNDEALARLGDIADFFLMHDRPIARPMDDSVLAVCGGEPVMMRRGRGLAPYSLPLPGAPDGWVAAGAQMKSAVAVTAGGNAVMSPHIGDLDHEGAARLWERACRTLAGLHGLAPVAAAADLHPGYAATLGAAETGGAGAGRAAPPCAHRGVHGGERAGGTGAGHRVGWHGAGDGRHDLGRRIPGVHARGVPAGGMAAAVSAGGRGCGGTGAAAGGAGGAAGDGVGASAAGIRGGGAGGAGCDAAGGAERGADEQRGAVVRRGGGFAGRMPDDEPRRAGGDAAGGAGGRRRRRPIRSAGRGMRWTGRR